MEFGDGVEVDDVAPFAVLPLEVEVGAKRTIRHQNQFVPVWEATRFSGKKEGIHGVMGV
jgi:hypothetical protein